MCVVPTDSEQSKGNCDKEARHVSNGKRDEPWTIGRKVVGENEYTGYDKRRCCSDAE